MLPGDGGTIKREILTIRLPGEIKNVTKEGNGAECRIDGHIHQHSKHGCPGNARAMGIHDQHAGDHGPEHVSKAGNKSDKGIEADAVAADGDPTVNQPRDALNYFFFTRSLVLLQASIMPCPRRLAAIPVGRFGRAWRWRSRRSPQRPRCAPEHRSWRG